MDRFRMVIEGRGETAGCDRNAKPGEKLFHRCARLTCPNCLFLDFVQLLRQKGFRLEEAEFIHEPNAMGQVVDDALKNERVSGEFHIT